MGSVIYWTPGAAYMPHSVYTWENLIISNLFVAFNISPIVTLDSAQKIFSIKKMQVYHTFQIFVLRLLYIYNDEYSNFVYN